MNIRGRNKVSAEFNMSSMTDLVFLLLIFFMILVTQLKQNNLINMNLPKSSSTTKTSQTVVVSVDKDLVYRVDNQVVTKEQIPGILQQKVQPEAKVDIAMDESVPHQYFVELVDIISIQNNFRIGIQTTGKQ